MVVTIGLAFTVEPMVALKPAAGAQLYVVAPLAVTLVPPPPEQIVAEVGLNVTVGVGFTVTTTTAVPEQVPVVPVTV